MTGRVRGTFVVAIVALSSGVACRQSSRERAYAAAHRLEGGARLSRTDVVQAAASPGAPGRIIYDLPADLSYSSARATRPDLVPPDTARR